MNKTATKYPDISIIIPCRNEEDYVGSLLKDIAERRGADTIEVIVADSASDDDTIVVVKKFTHHLPLKIVRLKNRGVSRARNAGADAAEGEWFFFFDAKVRIGPGYLQKALESLKEHNAEFGTSHFSTRSWHPFDRLFFWLWSAGFRYSYWRGDFLMNGSTIFIKHSLHRQLGGFNERLDIGEDIDYAKRVAAISTNGVFVPITMYLSNRRLTKRGRIRALLMVLTWHDLLPKKIAEWVNRDYYKRMRKPPLWRTAWRIVLHSLLVITMIYAVYQFLVS